MSSFLPLLFTIFAAITVVAISDPDLGYISSFCGQLRDADPPQLRNRAVEVTDLAVDFGTPSVNGTCESIEIKPFMYGFASCPTDVAPYDCTACLAFARTQLLDNLCKDLYGAQLTLRGCFLRYETYRFCYGN